MMNYDVIVVGAGPVGLMLACELGKHGVSHLVLDSKAEREYYCKALGVAPRTLEIFDHLGILDEALRRGFFFQAMNIVVGGQLVQRIPVQQARLPYGHFGMAQPHTEEILEDYWKRFGQSLERGATLVSVAQDAEGATATLEDGRSIRSRYLVGCDGAHSTVRKSLNLGFEGDRYPLTFVLGDVKLEWDKPPAENWQFIHLENGELRNVVTVIANPTAPGRYRVSAAVEDDFACPERPGLEVLRQVMGAALPEGTELTEMVWSSRYSISHRIASDYRVGRIFVAGDAAHIHPPIGGLGMNTGIGDAHNLGWKLAGALQGWLPESALDTYHSERHRVGRKVVEITAARMDAALGGEKAPEPADFDTALAIRYRPSPLVADCTEQSYPALPGERLPAVSGLKRPHVEGRLRTAELFRWGHFVLLASGADPAPYKRALTAVLRPEKVRTWSVFRDHQPLAAGGYFLDPNGEWDAQVGPGVVLVRPDGVIAWRGQSPDDVAEWLRSAWS